MAERKPLVLIDGQVQELPSGDTLPGVNLSMAVPINEFDTGATGTSSSSFAFKGNLFSVNINTSLLGVHFKGNAGQSVIPVIYKGTRAGGIGTSFTISEVLYVGSATTIPSTNKLIVSFPNISLNAGDWIAVGLHSQDSTDTDVLQVPSTGGGASSNSVFTHQSIFVVARKAVFNVSDSFTDANNIDSTGQVIISLDTSIAESFTGPAGADGASGTPGNTGIASYNSLNANGLTASTSAFATKGNSLIPNVNLKLNKVKFKVSTTPTQTVDVMVARMSDATATATIDEILHDLGTLSVVNPTNGTEFIFPTPLDLIKDQVYAIMFVRTDGTGVSPLVVSFPSGANSTDSANLWRPANNNGIRLADNNPALTEQPFDGTLSGGIDVEVDVEFPGVVPVGGTTGQVLAKIDGTDYNTQWVDPSSTNMVQTEITATAYSTVSADFAGNVVRRMNNASAQVITVEPSMTGGQPVTFIAVGAGAVSFSAGAGVTILSAGGNLSIADRYGSATLIPDATTADTYYLIGNLTT